MLFRSAERSPLTQALRKQVDAMRNFDEFRKQLLNMFARARTASNATAQRVHRNVIMQPEPSKRKRENNRLPAPPQLGRLNAPPGRSNAAPPGRSNAAPPGANQAAQHANAANATSGCVSSNGNRRPSIQSPQANISGNVIRKTIPFCMRPSQM